MEFDSMTNHSSNHTHVVKSLVRITLCFDTHVTHVSEGNAFPWMIEAFRLVPSKTCLYALFPLAGSDLYCFAKIKL